ncbi:conserved hypothetical protein [Trichinella spiralis]|uniref:hypothetical protein n=1 Tax=Trichinella spiralis TaxID=6334 RepID=UPI0001EFD21A|nr:conserved hypothetical protein [Trichinella spiralis]
MQIFKRCPDNSIVSSRRKGHNNYYCKLQTRMIILLIKSREKFSFAQRTLKSSHNKTRLPENICKFSFHCFTLAYVASVLMVVGVRCAVRVQGRFPYNEVNVHLKTQEWKMDVNDRKTAISLTIRSKPLTARKRTREDKM